MGSSNGMGALGLEDNPGPWVNSAGLPPAVAAKVANSVPASYVAAHEAGHGGSLPDEYIETSSRFSHNKPGFQCNTPGDPYSLDSPAMMMEGLQLIRARYMWHAAEWSRLACSGIEFRVSQDTITYALSGTGGAIPHHPQAPRRNFVYWPLLSLMNERENTRGNFDLFLYPLGDDEYSRDLKKPFSSGTRFDGIMVVLVKMRWIFTFTGAATFVGIDTHLTNATAAVETNFNKKFKARMTVGPFTFNNCLIHFMPRFLLETLATDNDAYLRACGYNPPAVPPATAAQRTTFINNNVLAGANSYATKIAGVETFHSRHFTIDAKQSIAAGSSNWGASSRLNLSLNDNLLTTFHRFFGDMVGLDLTTAGNQLNTASILQHIVRKVDAGGNVTNIP
jgi:hypothetical protein